MQISPSGGVSALRELIQDFIEAGGITPTIRNDFLRSDGVLSELLVALYGVGSMPPNPGTQRLIGLSPTTAFDPANNRVLGQPLCATATVTSQVKTTNQVDFSVSGQVLRKAATDNFWTLTGGVLAISSWRKYLLLVDSAGAASVLQSPSDSTTSAATVVLPTPPIGKAVFGTLTVATNGATTFTPGVTLLGAAGITATFVDGLDPLYAGSVVTTPAVTQGVGGAASTIAGAVLIPATVLSGTYILNPTAPWRYLGGNPVVKAQTFPDRQYVTPNNVNAANLTGSLSVEFEFDGSTFDFWVKGFTSSYRISVNDQAVSQYGTLGPPNDGAAYFINVNFGSRAHRRIRLDFSASGCHFGGLNVGPNDTVWIPSSPIGPRVIVFGDSFTDGSGATFRLAGYWDMLGKLMGWRDIWSCGMGGTGYLAPGSGVKLRDRVITDVINRAPDIILIAAGYNDSPTYTAAQIGAEATILFAQIRAALPNVKLIVAEQWSANGTPSQTQIDVREAIRTAVTADRGPHLFIDTIVATVPGANTLGWITGTGRVGATTGSGNADLYVSSDAIHPTQAGHDYYGRRFAAAIAAAMPF